MAQVRVAGIQEQKSVIFQIQTSISHKTFIR